MISDPRCDIYTRARIYISRGAMTDVDSYATTPEQYLRDYGIGPETGLLDGATEDPIAKQKLEDRVLRKNRRRAFDGTPLIDPIRRKERSLNARRFARSNRYPLNKRFLYGFITFIYVAAVVVFYSVPYVFFGRNIELGSSYGALLAWNSFKPVLIYAVIFSITQQRLSMFITFLFGGFALFVIIGTFVLQVAVLHDIFVVCNGDRNPTHPCNDPLYCCVYYEELAFCAGKGPCLAVNTSDLGIPYHEGIVDITKDDLKTNDNYNLMAYILAILFILEIIFVRYFTNMLYTINSGFSFIMDTTLEYEYEKRLPRDYELPIYPEDRQNLNSPYNATNTIDDDLLPLPHYVDVGAGYVRSAPDGGTVRPSIFTDRDEDDKMPFTKLKNKCFNRPSMRCGGVINVHRWVVNKLYSIYIFITETTSDLLELSVSCFNNIFVLRSDDPFSTPGDKPNDGNSNINNHSATGNAASEFHYRPRHFSEDSPTMDGYDNASNNAYRGQNVYVRPLGNNHINSIVTKNRRKKNPKKCGGRLMEK